ncbi:histidine kinase [Alicyclobacillus sp.]|uniref:histidine kinase n=1 Tax=Alicyclobacillus sp. TaxID=61169 RepID=UPI0025BED6BE|nr:histidine kinase [Alicyclobacillus sp.]MCL6516469.1 histidine kinase [Alicyclobacillus sp.]
MGGYTFLFLERSAVLLVGVFAFTRLPGPRRRFGSQSATRLWNVSIFSVVSLAGIVLGVDFQPDPITQLPWSWHAPADAVRIGPELTAVVIAGLVDGPWTGLGVGALAGVIGAVTGGATPWATLFAQPLAGVLAGSVARAFRDEGVLSPEKAVFVGLFAPILFCAMLLILPGRIHDDAIIRFVDTIGLPMVISDSLAIGLFSAIVRVAVQEADQAAAVQMQRALHVVEKTLSSLRWQLTVPAARDLAEQLWHTLPTPAVAVTDTARVLAHVGLGVDHHALYDDRLPPWVLQALRTGDIIVVGEADETVCTRRGCPLRGAMVVPFRQLGRIVGAIVLYTQHHRPLRAVDEEVARGLGRIISRELDLSAVEELRRIAQESRLRALQTQIHPHFLFNTLQLITGLIRQDPPRARHMVLRLAEFLRHSVESTRHLLVPLADEVRHARAYTEIVEARYPGRIQVTWTVHPEANALLPPCTLQPLIENAVKHGLGANGLSGRIVVRIEQHESFVRVEVLDDGPGFPDELLKGTNQRSTSGTGIGLSIVGERLEALFGPENTLHLENTKPCGARVWFTIPAGRQISPEVWPGA